MNQPNTRAIADRAMKAKNQRGRKRDRESTGGGLVLGVGISTSRIGAMKR
jgi:hypothetical protein